MKFQFRTALGQEIFHRRYAQGPNDSWPELVRRLVEDVCGTRWGQLSHPLMSKSDRDDLTQIMIEMKFIPGGRYLYYAGRPVHFFNNCYALRAEDTREGWGDILQKATLALMCGGGVGIDYSGIRPSGRVLSRTGGIASGPVPLMRSVNEVGRNVMQGGSRRSALWSGLNWRHDDIREFIHIKDWTEFVKQQKAQDYNFPAPLDMTNISVLFDDAFLKYLVKGSTFPELWEEIVALMLRTGEPGMCFNFGDQSRETLRNACTELVTEWDSDVCNLGSVNLGRIESLPELSEVVTLAAKFLVCGTLRADLPYEKVYRVREEHRKIGLGLMGVHEWLMRRGKHYSMTGELREWLSVYEEQSKKAADEQCTRFYLSPCERYQAIAPSGTISILAGTTSGIEPLFSVAIKRLYLSEGTRWKYQYVIDPTAQWLMNHYNMMPEEIETAYTLAKDPERRISFQASIQDYVDMGISSTINLPEWGSEDNNPDKVREMARLIAKYCYNLRGITVYPNNSRAGQTLTEVPYEEAKQNLGVIYDASEEQCRGGICQL